MISGYSKQYLSASVKKGKQYFQYEDYQIIVDQNTTDYQIIEKVGRGKYSDVYKCINVTTQQLAVMKVIKPIREAKIKRQIKILKDLSNLNNIIQLKNVFKTQPSNLYCLAFQYIHSKETLDFLWQMEIHQMKQCLLEILKGIEDCHMRGIIHRDIKPQNILICTNTQKIKLIDFGLAEYYLPGKEYNTRVCSRHYKPPQLFLNNYFYDYSLDIWSFGILFACVIFNTRIFLNGKDNNDQFSKILQVFGNGDVERYIYKYKLIPDQPIQKIFRQKNRKKVKLEQFIDENNCNRANKQSIDLLGKLLIIDHVIILQKQSSRITAAQAIKHPYFKTNKL